MSKDRQPSRITMGRWNRFMVIVLGMLLISFAGPAASAFWGSVSSGFGAAKADSVAQGAKPTTIVTGTTVTVNWAASTTAAGKSVTGYSIGRYSSLSGGTRMAATGTCQGTISALSCTESNVPAGTWYYAVTPMLSLWQGAESVRSAGTTPVTDTTPPNAPVVSAVTVINAALADKVPVSGTAEANSSVTLTVSGTGGQPISQTLAVNGSGNWTASPVDVRTFADGTINYSAKATDAAGNVSIAGTATSSKDATAPTVTNVQLGNGTGGTVGKIDTGDTVTITFSEPLTASTICSTWTSNTGQTLSGDSQVKVNISTGSVMTLSTPGCASSSVGSVTLGASYNNGSTVLTYSGDSKLVWNPTSKTLTVTLGSTVTGTPSNASRNQFPAVYTPVGQLTDVAANPLGTGPVSGTPSRF
ncbi:Ig-like domain-containing protein [Paenarthrobacter sp. JL.01a]|uniref:Ig-like domain-containing protein n=1 Tax=Paenarthrobacter sp. JL.01a TaxID=2979324 RepID=UPI0021C66036|nr:Ig-like domain-containing protein [Paenarthrobacter sp. JL.01a]UXM91522.1 Ig-like domain-containing protein [Paenarthrobacter sp. JL.01a]